MTPSSAIPSSACGGSRPARAYGRLTRRPARSTRFAPRSRPRSGRSRSCQSLARRRSSSTSTKLCRRAFSSREPRPWMTPAPADQPILSGLRIVELSAFIAGRLGGATLAALGADVIRVDPPGGGIDIDRWPLHRGRSLYWAGLNQGKRSVVIDTRSEAGRRQVAGLIAAPGEGGGIVLPNLPVKQWSSYEELSKLRRDLIMGFITGDPGSPATVDYTATPSPRISLLTRPLR